MATVTWGDSSGEWQAPTSWQGLRATTTDDTALFGTSSYGTATLDAPTFIASVTMLHDTGVKLQIDATVTVSGTLVAHGGTVQFGAGGVIHGGTIDLAGATTIGQLTLVDATWIGILGQGMTIDSGTAAATQSALATNALSVTG